MALLLLLPLVSISVLCPPPPSQAGVTRFTRLVIYYTGLKRGRGKNARCKLYFELLCFASLADNKSLWQCSSV